MIYRTTLATLFALALHACGPVALVTPTDTDGAVGDAADERAAVCASAPGQVHTTCVPLAADGSSVRCSCPCDPGWARCGAVIASPYCDTYVGPGGRCP